MALSEEELIARMAEQPIAIQLTRVAANMLRIMADDGHPYELEREMAALVKAVADARATTSFGHLDLSPLYGWCHDGRGLEPEFEYRHQIYDDMVQAALRLAASRLLGQTSQISAAHRALVGAVTEDIKWREKNDLTPSRRSARSKASRKAAGRAPARQRKEQPDHNI